MIGPLGSYTAAIVAAMVVSLPSTFSRQEKADCGRTEADRLALQAAADKRERKAAKRLGKVAR